MHKFVSVALDVPIYKLFDYKCTFYNAKVGARVKVPFGRSTRVGIIVKIFLSIDNSSSYKIKGIYDLLDDIPVLTPELLKTSKWTAKYYHYPLGQVLFNAITPIQRKNQAAPKKKYELERILKPESLMLNDEQLKVVKSIDKNINKYKVHFIHGVTGSGKTEIY